MNRALFILVCALASVPGAFSQSAGDPNDGARLRRDGPEDYIFSWWSASGKTYFLQQSDDLLTWTYFPPESGIFTGFGGVDEVGVHITGAAPSFLRLKSVPITSPYPAAEDFDGDKLSNYLEMTNGLDPLNGSDGDGDGLPSDWETWFGLNPNLADATLDADGDGQSNLAEFQANPSTDPTDYYNGHYPTVRIVGGNFQTNEPGTFSTLPLVLELKDGAAPWVNGPVTVWLENPNAGQFSASNDGIGLAATLLLHSGPDGLVRVWFRHSDTIPPAATVWNIFFTLGTLPTERHGRVDFRITTRKLYTYPPGTLGLHASQAIDTRLAGKNPANALAIFSTQNHNAQPPVYVRNTACWCYDLRQAMTCISPWYSAYSFKYGGTAITPQHIITSAHIDPLMLVGNTIRFITANDVIVTRTIVGKARHPDYQGYPFYYPDLTVYTLSSPLPATITPCKILPANYASHLGELERYRVPILALDQLERARVFDLVELTSSAGGYPPSLEPDREAFFDIYPGEGDSGNPMFLIVNDTLVLLTTLTFPGGGTFVTPQLAALNAMIAAADADATARNPQLPPFNTGFQMQTIDLSGFSPFTPP